MPDNLIQIGVEVDLKKLTTALAESKTAVQEHTDDMAKQFKKLAKESQTALDDLKKTAKLSGLEISDSMTGVLEQVPKVAQGLSALFSGGGILAFIGVLIGVATALKGLYEDVIALKGAKEEWQEINKKLADSEDSLQAKLRKDAIEYVRLTRGQAAAAHLALKLADKELVEISKNVDQILAGKKVDKLSEGLRKDLEALKHFTFAELPGKIHDVDEAIKRADGNVKKLNDRFLKIAGFAPAFGDLGNAVLAYFGASVEKAEGERKALQGIREELKLTERDHKEETTNDKLAAARLDAEQQIHGFKERLQKQKDALDAFHTMSTQAEVKYWDDIIATHRVKGKNLEEIRQLRWEAQKEVARKGLEDEVAAVEKNVAAEKNGSQERVQILNNEIAQMEAHRQNETAEYKHMVEEKDRAVQDATRKEFKDEVQAVQEQAKAYKAGSAERVKIFHDEVEKLKSEKKTDTDEFKRLVAEESQAERDLAKVFENVAETERKSRTDHEEALKKQDLAQLEFERQLGQTSEAQYEKLLLDRITVAYQAELKELEIKKRLYQQDPLEFAKVKAAIIKLNDKYHADIEKADQKAYLRQKAAFDKYFSQISSSFTSELNSWIQGTETIAQAFSKMFQSMIMSLVNYMEQKAMTMLEDWLFEKLFMHKKAAGTISSAAAQTFANAFAASASTGLAGLAAAPGVAAGAAATVTAGATAILGVGDSSAGGQWIVPQDQLNFVHKNETILPAGIASGLRNMIENGGGGGGDVHVHFNVNAIDSASFKDTVGKHGHMIGELVTKALKKKGIK